ncbi:flagellar motor switch protein FliN, partial [Leptospira stimsonii]|uniref:flagellar motor switch protein FliN n=1 Tax=Leptospira stimsonii TaxID=2202203 RepID=UPI001FEF1728
RNTFDRKVEEYSHDRFSIRQNQGGGDMGGMGMGGMGGMGMSAGSMSVKSVAFPNLGTASGASSTPNLNLLMDVQMSVTVELGRTKMYIKDILGLGEGSIIELDKLAGEPVDLLVNGKLIAKGEVVVIDENFGVRVTDIVSPTDRIKPEGK